MLKLLQDNPEVKLEISSHTDSRGSDSYNLQLSQRRADAIVAWLASKGIPADRLVAKGYGETKPVNDCSDGRPCSEEQYQLNRRTEFKVLEKR
ncbi:MAG: OmpA family protein [Saprospiraceae bacterium]|nr:OmpA family protein [Saprospiraceae bacterium]